MSLNSHFSACITALTLALAVAACSSDHHGKRAASDKQAPPTYMLYSPNGEPLNGGSLGRPSCQQAMSGWFERMSAGGNALIGKEVFLADARAQFARMDIDHNGYIVSEELDRFREPYRQQPAAQKPEEKDKDADTQEGEGAHGGHKGKGGRGGNAGQSDPSFTLSDPVMSADTNLDFKVTPEEFLKKSEDAFVRLDSNHDGFLDRTEIMTGCEPKKNQ